MKKFIAYFLLPYPSVFILGCIMLTLVDSVRFEKSPVEVIGDGSIPPGYFVFFSIVLFYQFLFGSLPLFIVSKLKAIRNWYFMVMAVLLSGLTARIMWDDGDAFFILQASAAFVLSFFGYLLAWRIVRGSEE